MSNMEKRVEILFPIFEGRLKKKIMHLLTLQLSDNTKGREQDQYGEYHYLPRRENEPEVDSQAILVSESNYITEDVAE